MGQTQTVRRARVAIAAKAPNVNWCGNRQGTLHVARLRASCAKPETLHGDANDANADSDDELRLLTRTSIIQILQAKNPPHLDESRPRACTDGVQDDSFGYHS